MEYGMNIKTAVSALMSVSLVAGGPVFAQAYGDRNDRGREGQAQQERQSQQERRGDEGRQSDRRDNEGRGNHNDERREERGAGPNHSFHKGERMPAEYRHQQYVVDDWRGHDLSAPPRGYHWVQTGGDYVLIAITTGIIAELLLNR
jgi:Ni/Co efflux regulator RcnB